MAIRHALVVATVAAMTGCTVKTPPYIMSAMPISGPAFRQSIEASTRSPIVGGNQVDLLVDGDHFFPSMLEAIRTARATITFSQYVYEKAGIAEEFSQTLSERCRAGIGVSVLLDSAGALNIPTEYVDLMKVSGCHVAFFRPLRPWQLSRSNHRLHRRLLIVDGNLAFTGGWGVSEKWTGDGKTDGKWHDTGVRLHGPVVKQLQQTFMQDWRETTGIILDGDPYIPPLVPVGNTAVQVVSSSPIGGSYDTYLVLLLTIGRARRSIEITNPYFLPDERLEAAIIAAVARGVKVRVLLPGKIDHPYVRSASRRGFGKMMRAGIEIYEYQPALLHSKTIVIDSFWSMVGSANLDKRSLALNEELNIAVYDRDFGAKMEQLFEDDLTRSRRVTYRDWRHRGPLDRLLEIITVPLQDQL